jgi:hypothetical protein
MNKFAVALVAAVGFSSIAAQAMPFFITSRGLFV